MRKYLDANIIENTKDMPKNEWLMKRKCGIGGSDASSILGFNPYRSSMAVYIDKICYAHLLKDLKGEKVSQNSDCHIEKDLIDKFISQDNETSYKMELGNKLKSFVASEFMLKTGKKDSRSF